MSYYGDPILGFEILEEKVDGEGTSHLNPSDGFLKLPCQNNVAVGDTASSFATHLCSFLFSSLLDFLAQAIEDQYSEYLIEERTYI
jgi:hypothetical protein